MCDQKIKSRSGLYIRPDCTLGGKDVNDMKATGIIRRFDSVGRVVIPKEIRERIWGTKNTDDMPVEFF